LIKFDNFDQVLNNFTFAEPCLFLGKKLDELNVFLSKSDPKPQEMVALMSSFNVSPESFIKDKYFT
jgi:hypothetical protein